MCCASMCLLKQSSHYIGINGHISQVPAQRQDLALVMEFVRDDVAEDLERFGMSYFPLHFIGNLLFRIQAGNEFFHIGVNGGKQSDDVLYGGIRVVFGIGDALLQGTVGNPVLVGGGTMHQQVPHAAATPEGGILIQEMLPVYCLAIRKEHLPRVLHEGILLS